MALGPVDEFPQVLYIGGVKSIILMGMKHSGKSTLGRLASDRLGLSLYDLDDLLVRENPQGPVLTPREIHRQLGPQVFQDWEALSAERLAQTMIQTPCVLALGGGTIENPRAMQALKGKGLKIFLDDEPQVLFDRIMRGGLPSFLSADHPWEDFQKLYHRRTALYQKAADRTLDCRNLGVQEVLKKFLQLIKE